MFADLHIHSWYSDGTLSVDEIIKKAKSQNISVISICDHNLIDAYTELENLCSDINNGIRIIKGVEINAVTDGMEYHILAYGFDAHNEKLNELLKYNCGVYSDIAYKLIKNMSADYASISLEEFLKYERNRRNGGWESVDYLKSKGLVSNFSDYFNFVKEYGEPPGKDFLSPPEVIKIIQNAGGSAVLAHIGEYTRHNLELCKKTAVEFAEMGIDGFECYYPAHNTEITEFLVNFCRRHDMMITAGSDEHGEFGDLSERGFYIGAVKTKIERLNTI